MRSLYNFCSRRPGRLGLTAVLLAAAGLAGAAEPVLQFGAKGLDKLQWGGNNVLGGPAFGVDRVVLERRDGPPDELWGHRFTSGAVKPTKVEVDQGKRRVLNHYPWGRAELLFKPAADRLDLVLTLHAGPQAIADFRLRLLSFGRAPGYGNGAVFQTLDRPVWYQVPLEKGKVLVTCETFDQPLQFGLSRSRGSRRGQHSLIALGGVAAAKPGTRIVPIMGVPHVAAGTSLRLRFVLRFARREQPDAVLLQPFFEAFRAAQKPFQNWPDRRPIGKVMIPASPRKVTLANVHGWFDAPKMAIGTPAGDAEFRKRLLELADKAVAGLKRARAQGVVVWDIEGRYSYPDYPYGAPRHVKDIAPEMDKHADAFFQKFRDAGLKTGVCIRPSLVFYSERRQRWTHGPGYYDPKHEKLPGVDGVSAAAIAAQRFYPLAERLAAKIAYAKKRWGCTIFYIHDNGYWFQAAPGREPEWILFDAGTLRRLRRLHPDVLLIPRYADRHWRPMRAAEFHKAFEKHQSMSPLIDPFRGFGSGRIGGVPTPDWVLGNGFRVRHHGHGIHRTRAVVGPRHLLHQAYWANAAPYIELQLKRRIREHMLTLEQHMEYSHEKAEAMAAEEVPFETTPSRVRDWMPGAFSVNDVTGADTAIRRTELIRASAWGDILMWDATGDAGGIREIYAASLGKQQRVCRLAEHLGLIKYDPAKPVLPVALIWRRGESLDTGKLVLDRPVPGDFRARVAYAADRKRALLMLAWRGGPGRNIRLQPGLPGVKLAGPDYAVWEMPGGVAVNPKAPIRVQPDAVAGVNAFLLDSTNAVKPGPDGLVLGVSFDRSPAPDLGGGPPAARRGGTVTGGALQLGGEEALYNVVPSWHAGTVEFDLEAQSIGKAGLPILAFRHHIDLELRLTPGRRGNGLALRVRETTPAGKTEERRAFAKFASGRRHHVVLVWDIGQYVLYVDGRQAAAITAPAATRNRDGSVLEPGLVVGGKGSGKGVLDSLLLYDWPFTDKQAAARRRVGKLQPLPREQAPNLRAWVWGSFPKQVYVGVNARAAPRWGEAAGFAIRLYKRSAGGRRQVAAATVPAFGGMAIGALKYHVAKTMESANPIRKGDGGDGDDGPEMGLGDDDDFGDFAEIDKTIDTGTPYAMDIIPLPAGSGPPKRTILFSAGKDGPSRNRW